LRLRSLRFFRPTRLWRLALAAAGFVLPAISVAQEASPETALPESVCAGGRISSIFIDNHSIFDLADPHLDPRLARAYRLVNQLHVPTRASVIRRELTFKEGDCYDPAVLAESERIVRAAPFIAAVDIYGIRQPDGSYHVIVDTRDEWSTRLEPQTEPGSGLELSGVSLREDNLFGTGRQLSVYALKRYDERTYGATFFTPQLFGTRWDAGLAAGRSPVGPFFSEVLAYPFLGEEGRWAARQQIRQDAFFFEYVVPSDDELVTVLLPEQRRILDVGAVRRFGSRGRLTLVGAALAGEHITYPEGVRFAEPDEVDTLGTPLLVTLRESFRSTSTVRALLLVGQRNVDFVRRRALDTVHGTEDVRIGVEAEAALGHTLGGLSDERGPSVELGIFAATEPARGVLTGAQLTMEGRREGEPLIEHAGWNDVFAQLEGWAYWRPTPVSHTTLVAALSAVGGWHTTVPFQLTLGGGSGLRGYPRHLYPGGQRVVASLETRTYVPWPLPELFDLGLVSFVDFGRIWSGDVRFGETSPYQASVGLGLRTAFPPGSPRTFRLDVGVPLQPGLKISDVGIRIGIGQAIGPGAVRFDPQLRRSSRRGLSTSLFRYPN